MTSGQDDTVEDVKTASFYKSRMTSTRPSTLLTPNSNSAPRDVAVIQQSQQQRACVNLHQTQASVMPFKMPWIVRALLAPASTSTPPEPRSASSIH